MSFFRSDDMEYHRIIMPRDSAWHTMNLIGKENLMHVVPNTNLHSIRPFAAQVKRCEEALLKIKAIEKVIEETDIGTKREFLTDEQYHDLNLMWEVHEKTGGNEQSRFTAVEEQINKDWKYYQDLAARKSEIKEKLQFLRENIAIIKAGKKHYGSSFFKIRGGSSNNIEVNELLNANQLELKAFVTEAKSVLSAQRTLNRVSRGNSFINTISYDQIFDKTLQEEEAKYVVFVVYPARKDSLLDKKVKKVLDNYCKNWTQYALPNNDMYEFKQRISKIEEGFTQSEKLLKITKDQTKEFLLSFNDKVEGKNITQLEYYKFYLLKERQIYTQLNEMTSHSNFIDGQVYIRQQDVEEVMQIMVKAGIETQMPPGRLEKEEATKMPTYYKINDFKLPSQEITNTYGIPRYKQANPSVFSLVTFPFLFGVMFGDIAHGFIAFAFGVYLMNLSPGNKNGVLRALYPYRYLITLMGFFATYCGFIYNDFLSISLNLFDSCFDIHGAEPEHPIHKVSSDCVYPFGLDPAWAVASNNLNYVNSLKMKISVIIAVVHMTLGVFVKASNALYFGKKLDFIFEFVPQLLFLVGLFGYMDFLIVYKWLKPWKLYESAAPSIITTMINLPLKMGKTDKCCGGQPMWGEFGTTSQNQIQFILLAVGLICVPLMLLPKPIIEIMSAKKHDKEEKEGENSRDSDRGFLDNEVIEKPQVSIKQIQSVRSIASRKKIAKQEEHEHDAGQIFVHQLIETIQYVLGCISNTASYLRLWALSLAHSQLSEVFFQKTVEGGLQKGHSGVPILILGFPILAGATFGVLLCMDSMECFLHTLRLHWVEFQNKFYKGDGFLFNPVSFRALIQESVAKMA